MKQILKRPVVTEKSNKMQEVQNKYTFIVAKDANKIEIRNAVESFFDVKVDKVATVNYEGQAKRVGKYLGKKSDYKKAVITLKGDKKINYYEE